MSRVGKIPIDAAARREVTIARRAITVKGPLGSLTQRLDPLVDGIKRGRHARVRAGDESREANAMSGTLRALVANMVNGVTKGFERKLTLVGVGYRAQARATS